MSARRRQPARRPAPLRHHFGLTALIAATVLFTAIVLVHDGDPAIFGGMAAPAPVILSGAGRGGNHRLAGGPTRLHVTWTQRRLLAVRAVANLRRAPYLLRAIARRVLRCALRRARTMPAALRRAAVAFGRWLLADQHAVTLIPIGAVITVIAVVVAASPASLAIPAATALGAGLVAGVVLTVRHRHDPIRPGSVLGGKGGAR